MDELLELVGALVVLWRAVLAALFAALVSFVLSLLLPSFPPGAWFAFIFVGASVGVVWQAAVAATKESASKQRIKPISRPVAFLGIALVGGFWGSLVASVVGPYWAALGLVLSTFLLGVLFGRISGHRISVGALLVSAIAALVGLAAPYAINIAFAAPNPSLQATAYGRA